MTRWAMIADLGRCVGCQTCTAACRHTNATSPAVQWRKVLDVEVGAYPDVRRAFVPVGCMHCADPPCMHVCPTTATRQRDDGIVTIDYDLCIGCAYCMVACPYQARYKVTKPTFAYGSRMESEARREDPARLGVAQKCNFCSDRIDYGLENGLVPGIDPQATPACVNSCIADALHFGDAEDPESNVSTLLKENKHFLMHDELETGSGFYYLWESADGDGDPGDATAAAESMDRDLAPGSADIAPVLQTDWDWRAAGNFISGGSGAGLFVAAAIAFLAGAPVLPFGLLALAFIGLGLFLVWLETGRPLRAPLNVFFNPQTSWMTRESMVAVVLFPLGAAAVWQASPELVVLAAVVAFGFLYCQGRILKAAKGIPAWREGRIVPLIVVTGLTEGAGLYVIASRVFDAWFAPVAVNEALWMVALLSAIRAFVWLAYRRAIESDAPTLARRALAKANPEIILLGLGVPLVAVAVAEVFPIIAQLHLGSLAAVAGLGAVVGGWYMKFIIVVGASYNQGYAIQHTPERGAGGGGRGIKPGWS